MRETPELGRETPELGTYTSPHSPRPVPSTHQVAQLGRLLLVIVQPSQGAGPVFVHPEAHASSNSRGQTLESPARGRSLRPDAETSSPANSKSRDVTTGRVT